MALFYTSVLRGTILVQNWAVSLHWRITSGAAENPEALLCRAIAEMCRDFYVAHYHNMTSSHTVLTKVKVEAYGDPEGFYELPAASIGDYSKDISPAFVAKGFRQFRSNSLFRTSTHRFPEVMEENNISGDWVNTTDVSGAKIDAVSAFLTGNREVPMPDGITSIHVQPVLIRTQHTVTDPVTHTKETTYFVPPQISDVADAGFYGITSQVSRKYILPT